MELAELGCIIRTVSEVSKNLRGTLILDWAKGPNRHFFKGGVQMVNRSVERHSASLVIKKMQIRIAGRCHLTPVRMALVKTTRGNKYQ